MRNAEKFLSNILPYFVKRKQVTKVTFLVKEQNVSVISIYANGISSCLTKHISLYSRMSVNCAYNLAWKKSTLGLFSHDGKVRILNFNLRCAFWIKIQNTQKRLCVCQITSQNVIWNAHLKSRYRGVFQLRFSQITQRNLCMNDLTSEWCFGGRS